MTLTEKRQQMVDRLEDLKASRALEIEAKVAAYKATLEAEEIVGAAKIVEVIKALDTVIAFDDGTEEMERPMCKEATPEPAVSATVARPGMAGVFAPRR